jgi:hypothetical protein
MGTPIINQPEVAILALGIIKKRPEVITTEKGDEIAIRSMMYLSLSFDHRVVDGFLGGSFLRKVGDYLEQFDNKPPYKLQCMLPLKNHQPQLRENIDLNTSHGNGFYRPHVYLRLRKRPMEQPKNRTVANHCHASGSDGFALWASDF